MTLEQAIELIKNHLARMDDLYGKKVFDEWAVVTVFERKAGILHYVGPRREDLQETFANDIRHFSKELMGGRQHIGHFDFSRDASGVQFDAYIVIGEGCFLVCNNTTQSMAGITKEARWLRAQVPFAELSEKLRSDPLIHFA